MSVRPINPVADEASSASTAASAVTDLPTGPLSKLPSWYAAYLALAILNLVVLTLSLGLNYRQANLLGESAGSYRIYAGILEQINMLGVSGVAASLPATNIFSSRDIALERTRLLASSAMFRQQYALLRHAVADRLPPATQSQIAANFPRIDTEWDAMLLEAQSTFESFAKGRIDEASQHSAVKTAHFNKLVTYVMMTAGSIRRTQLTILSEQQSRARSVQVFGAWLVVGSAFVAIAVFLHARHVRRTTRLQKAHRERLIQELALARDQAEYAVNVKARFLANMSHEIRTPMNGVLGMLDALAATPLSATQSNLLKTANTAADLLLATIDDVLDFSKIETGMLVIEAMPVNVFEIVRYVHSLYNAPAVEKMLNLRYELPQQSLPRLLSDATRLTQVLSNLVSNAIKFTTAGEVVVSVEVLEEQTDKMRIKFAVRDTGIGVEPDLQARLFSPFMQADNSTSRRYGGTGLGLAICKQLISLLDKDCGEIAVKSQPKVGTTFYFVLQLLKTSEQESHVETFDVTSNNLGAVAHFAGRVLIAEDNAINQNVANTMLQSLGLWTSIAHNGREAVEAVQRERFDLILMDYHMPELDGCDATQHIRRYEQEHNSARTPIIAVTASVLEEDKERCMASGMDDFLAKPIRQRTLVAMLGKWLPQQGHSHTAAIDKRSTDEPFGTTWSTLPPELFDIEQLLEMRLITAESFNDLIEQFHSSTREGLKALRNAIANNDAGALQRAAHKLKGATATLGAKTLAEHCYALETMGRERRLDTAQGHLTSLERDYLQVRRHMDACATPIAATGS